MKTSSKNKIPSIATSNNVYGTNAEEAFKVLNVLDAENDVGFDMIPPKLVKVAASVLYQALSNAIDNSLPNGIFPDNVKLPWFRHSTKVLLKRKICRIFYQLVF